MENGRARSAAPVTAPGVADYFAGVYQWPGGTCTRGTSTSRSPVRSQMALGAGLCTSLSTGAGAGSNTPSHGTLAAVRHGSGDGAACGTTLRSCCLCTREQSIGTCQSLATCLENTLYECVVQTPAPAAFAPNRGNPSWSVRSPD